MRLAALESSWIGFERVDTPTVSSTCFTDLAGRNVAVSLCSERTQVTCRHRTEGNWSRKTLRTFIAAATSSVSNSFVSNALELSEARLWLAL